MAWKVNKQEVVYKSKWLTVTQDEVESELGHKMTWSRVAKNPAVLVIPWDGEYTYIVGLYRYPVDAFSWEFVEGNSDFSSTEESARVELEEETGLKGEKFEKIGEFFLAPGFCNQHFHIYVATGLTQGVAHPEPDEVAIKVKNVTLKEMESLIEKKEIMDGPTIAALAFFKAFLNKGASQNK